MSDTESLDEVSGVDQEGEESDDHAPDSVADNSDSSEDGQATAESVYRRDYLNHVYGYLTNGIYPRGCTQNQKRALRRNCKTNYKIEDDVLYHRVIRKPRDREEVDESESESDGPDEETPWKKVLLNKEERIGILRMVHTSRIGGHLGITKTMVKAEKSYYWPNMTQDVKEYIRKCDRCQRNNTRIKGAKAPLHPIPVKKPVPWYQIGMDLIGPMHKSSTGDKLYICTVTDYYTKWAEAKAICNKEAITVAKVMYKMFLRHGFPRVIISDQGREFCNLVIEEICTILMIDHRTTTAYHPQCNGLTERFNRTLTQMLQKQLGEKSDQWCEYLQDSVFAYNTSIQASTKQTPFLLMYGREAVLPCDVPETNDQEAEEGSAAGMTEEGIIATEPQGLAKAVLDRLRTLDSQRAHVAPVVLQNIQRAQEKQKEHYDRRNTSASMVLKVGDKVLKKNNRKYDRKGGKQEDAYTGPPYVVVSVNSKGGCKIRNKDKVLKKTVSVDQLKRYYESESDDGLPKTKVVRSSSPSF